MNNKQYGLAVYIGRFEPFHLGHAHVVDKALEIADHVLILVGDTGGPRSVKNPWTFEERYRMINNSYAGNDRISIEPVFDHPNDTIWIAGVNSIVADYSLEFSARFPHRCADYSLEGERIAIIGHMKDESSKYLKWFHPWDVVDTGVLTINDVPMHINATQIREFFFFNKLEYARGVLSDEVYGFLNEVKNKDEMLALAEEFKHIEEYKKSWSAAPFPPVFMTTDAVVIQSGKVLMIRRKDNPGKGLLALPGGFLGIEESLETSMLRELYEETNIKLQEDTLRRCIITSKIFDDPKRSLRGRTITNAFLIKLEDSKELPKVRGGDDAAEAMWVPIASLDPREVFEDHYHIITAMLQHV